MRRALLSAFFLFAGCTAERNNPSDSPTYGGTVRQEAPLEAVRPVVGGQLTVTPDGQTVAVTDADANEVRFIDVSSSNVIATAKLPDGSWPTRIISNGANRYEVLLRGTGELATITLEGGNATITRTAACPEPRGLTLAGAQVLVSCAGGELVHVGASTTVARYPVEWRDVLPTGDGVVGASFRSAELVTLKSEVITRQAMPSQRVVSNPINPAMHQGQVAWRLLKAPDAVIVLHQLHSNQLRVDDPMSPLPPDPSQPSGYGGGSTGGSPNAPPGTTTCSEAAVVTGVTRINAAGETLTARTNDVLPVDAALSPDGTLLAIAGAGGTGLSVYPTAFLRSAPGCMTPTAGIGGLSLTSVAWLSNTRLVVLELMRRTPMVFDLTTGRSQVLAPTTPAATGASLALFHQAPAGGAALACASCHPEGADDGHVWLMNDKPRRTQSLLGGVMSRAPFHWVGDLTDLSALMGDTFVRRMGARPVDGTTVTSLGTWLDTLPASKPSRVLSDAEHAAGLAAFQKGGCQSCHLSNGLKEGPASDIGTGEAVRSPSLQGVVARAPYLHDGQLPSLEARINGGLHPQHGSLASLTADEKQSLLAYLQSL